MAAVIQTMEQQLQEPVLETGVPSQSKMQAILKTPQFKKAVQKAHNPNINTSKNRKSLQHKTEKNNRSLS